tara:strand:- start:96 stop:362 length:267 start_codon:yes stop_codon:yes gene_type:complete
MSKNKVYSNDPQASRYQKPRTVLDASIEKNKRKADHYRMREINKDVYDPTEPFPSDITKDAESKRLYDKLGRQEKLYGRFARKDEREA